MALTSTKHAFQYLRPFLGLNGAITKSRFWMQLLVIYSIDANDEVLPVAWGLVPIENTQWWTWFLEAFKECFDDSNDIN
jgi:hypothetical protein